LWKVEVILWEVTPPWMDWFIDFSYPIYDAATAALLRIE